MRRLSLNNRATHFACSRLNSGGTRRGQQAAALRSTRPGQCLHAFPQFTTIDFDRILAAEPGMTCYSSEGPSDYDRLGLTIVFTWHKELPVGNKGETVGPAAR